MENNCTFCNPQIIRKQEIFVIGSVRVLYPRRPVIPANVLITPVRCIEHVHELSNDEIHDVFEVTKRMHEIFQKIFSTTGYNFFVNDGYSAGQHIQHVHFHIFGRSENESVNPFYVLNDKEKYASRPAMEEIEYEKNINKIKALL